MSEKKYVYDLGTIVEFKKPHPCISRSKQFEVVRMGADIKVKCLGCGKIIMLSRSDFEDRIKRIIEYKKI